MKTYKIRVTEILSRVVEVTAENEDEAMENVEDMVNCEDIVLDADDFAGREFYFEE